MRVLVEHSNTSICKSPRAPNMSLTISTSRQAMLGVAERSPDLLYEVSNQIGTEDCIGTKNYGLTCKSSPRGPVGCCNELLEEEYPGTVDKGNICLHLGHAALASLKILDRTEHLVEPFDRLSSL